MLFTQQVFHLECLLLFQILLLNLNLVLLIKVLIIRKHLLLFFSLLKMKKKTKTFPHEFVFVFILYFIGTLLSEKFDQKQGVQKEYKKGGWPYRGVVYRRGVQTFTLILRGCEGDLGALNYWGGLNWMGELILKRRPQTPLHIIFSYRGLFCLLSPWSGWKAKSERRAPSKNLGT